MHRPGGLVDASQDWYATEGYQYARENNLHLVSSGIIFNGNGRGAFFVTDTASLGENPHKTIGDLFLDFTTGYHHTHPEKFPDIIRPRSPIPDLTTVLEDTTFQAPN